jgi:uncharacterized membrane protein SirB2
MSYLVLKHSHLLLAVVSISLFVYRFVLHLKASDKLQQKWLKIVPHIIDTFLLIFGVSMAVMASINPFQHHWLLAKLCLVVLYIVFGYIALKKATTTQGRIIAFSVAIMAVLSVVHLAMSKPLISL